MIPSGVPTALSTSETRLLRRWARDRRVVEAGALLGYSTIVLAQHAAHVVSIDKHSGYSGETERRFRSNLARAGVEGKVTVDVGDATSRLPQHPGDLAFIDLTCEEGLTRAAIEAARAPFVALHDYGRQGCPALPKVVDSFLSKGWRVAERADTLIVMAQPALQVR